VQATAEILTTVSQIRAIPEFKAIEPRQRRFIIAYSRSFNIQIAAQLAGCSWPSHYAWLKRSESYKRAFEFAREIAGDFAEGDVYQRAFIGEDRKVTKIKGESIITEEYKDKSDVLAIFALKGLKPQYRDSYNPQGSSAPIALSITYPGQPTIDITQQPQPVVIDDKSK